MLAYIHTYIHTHIKHTDNILGILLVRDFGFFVCPRGDVPVGVVSCRVVGIVEEVKGTSCS